MTYSLYLDDERNPKTKCPIGDKWVVVRSCRNAMIHIYDNGFPAYMSLDHDLGDMMPTGHTFTKLFIDHWLHTEPDCKFPMVNYHTANPVGRENMKGVVDGFVNYFKLEVEAL